MFAACCTRAFVADRNCWQLTDLGRSFRPSASRAENAFRHRSVCTLRDSKTIQYNMGHNARHDLMRGVF